MGQFMDVKLVSLESWFCTHKEDTIYGYAKMGGASTGDVIHTFSTIKEATEKLGVRKEYISQCIRGRSKTAGGYKWSWDVV